MTFEHQLKVIELPDRVQHGPCAGVKFFTESLILAQDERWRRA